MHNIISKYRYSVNKQKIVCWLTAQILLRREEALRWEIRGKYCPFFFIEITHSNLSENEVKGIFIVFQLI